MLPQLPILLALYSSILRTPELQVGKFLWMELGKHDPYFVMPILSALLTLATSYISSMQQPETNATTKIMTFVPAIMILIVGLNLPSALTIYWVASNLFQLAQTFIFQNPLKYRREIREKEQLERNRRRKLNKAKKKIYKKIKKSRICVTFYFMFSYLKLGNKNLSAKSTILPWKNRAKIVPILTAESWCETAKIIMMIIIGGVKVNNCALTGLPFVYLNRITFIKSSTGCMIKLTL